MDQFEVISQAILSTENYIKANQHWDLYHQQTIKALSIPDAWIEWYQGIFNLQEYAIEWLLQYCIELDFDDPLVGLNQIQRFCRNLAEQYTRIITPIESGFACQLKRFRGKIRSAVYPFLDRAIIHPLNQLFREIIEQNYPKEHSRLLLETLVVVFQSLEPFQVSKPLQDRLITSIQLIIEDLIQNNEYENYSFSLFMSLIKSRLGPILPGIFTANTTVTQTEFERLIEFQVYKCLGTIFINEAFDKFKEFPESKPALLEMKMCLEKTGDIKDFIKSFNRQIESRVLIIDAKTNSILQVFLLVKKSMLVLTPNVTFQDMVLEPIKMYLQSRKDCIREVLLWILESSDPDCDDVLEEEDIETLLSIFPSKANFAKEYHQILSEQLIKRTDFETQEQIRHVEVLTSKFGESVMAQSKVMLKDLADSRRVFNAHSIHHHTNLFSSLVVSHLFWPKLPESKLEPPEIIKEHMKGFAKTYEETKTGRKLHWMPEQGCVELLVERDDQEPLELVVSPLEATLLLLFTDQHEWDLKELTEKVSSTLEKTREAIQFWSSHNVLAIHGSVVVLINSASTERINQLSSTHADDHLTEHDQNQNHYNELVASTWPMIKGMLTNLGSLPSTMIHRTLGMFASDSFQFSLDVKDLEQFLDFLVHQDKLDVEDGKYKIKK